MKPRIPAVWAVLALILVAVSALGLMTARYRNRVFVSVGAAEQLLLTPWLSPAYLGDGKHAKELLLCYPMGLALDNAGNLFISDRGRARRGRVVWRIDRNGTAHIVAGTGRPGSARESSARRLSFNRPEGLAVDHDGRLHVADAFNHVVLRIEADDRVVRVAGTGSPGFSGDGGLASEAALNRPADIRFDSEGNLYIADVRNHRVRKIDRAGRISTVAGTGAPGLSGDGQLAVDAPLNSPWGIAVDREDRLLIADSENHLVRRVEPDGTLVTLAGSRRQGFSGDGGAAVDASFDSPQALFVDDAGRLFIGDEHNNAVRMVQLDGTVSTPIGVGTAGLAPDGSRAQGAALNDPENIVVRPDGSMIVTDGENGRVIEVTSGGVIKHVAGRGEIERCASRFGFR